MSETVDDWKDIRPFLPPVGQRLTLPGPERPPCERCGTAPRARALTMCEPCWQDWAEEESRRNPYGDPYAE